MFSYVIIVNDDGEMKTITQAELDDAGGAHTIEVEGSLETVLSDILDRRSAAQDALKQEVAKTITNHPAFDYAEGRPYADAAELIAADLVEKFSK